MAIQHNRTGRTRGVGELLGHESPAALEMGLDVEDVHGTASTSTSTAVLGEQLRHDFIGRDARSESVRMFSIIRVLDIFFGKGISYERGNRLLPII